MLVLSSTAYLSAPLLLPVEKAFDNVVTFKYNDPYPSIVHVDFIPIFAYVNAIPSLIVNLLLLIKSLSFNAFILAFAISFPLV